MRRRGRVISSERFRIIGLSMISVLLMLSCVFLVVVPSTATAAQDGDYTYTTSGSPAVATITGYTGAGGAITIPSTLGGYAVVAIGDGAFYGSSSLTSVILPSSVTTLGNGAFAYSSLTSVVIPGSIETIEPGAFSDCYFLTSITMLDGVKTIANAEFVNCYSLASVTIPSSVTSIGFAAFSKCKSLTSIEIPSSVTSIGDQAFIQCFSLTLVTIQVGVMSLGSWTFAQCTALTSVIIPDSVNSVGDYAFNQCTGLINVTMGSSVSSIGESAFSGCINLTSIAFLGLAAPVTVGPAWISGTDPGIRGHAYIASNFPAPGGSFNGLTMGAIIPAAPGPPADLVATSGDAQVLLTWSPPGSDGGRPVTSYNLYRSLTSGGSYVLIASPSAPPYLDASLTNGQTYWYTLRALNVIGEGDKAGPIASTPATEPTVPENLTATGGVNRVSLTWQAPSSSGGLTILRYEIYRGLSEHNVGALIGNVTSGVLTFQDTAVTANTTYYYLVKAINAVGPSLASNVANGTTPPATLPDAPRNVTATPGVGKVTITWQTPISDGGSAISGYKIYRVLAGESILLANVSSSARSYNDSTVATENSYTYYVVAVNDVGPGPNSTQAAAIPSGDNTMLYIGIGAIAIIALAGGVFVVLRKRK